MSKTKVPETFSWVEKLEYEYDSPIGAGLLAAHSPFYWGNHKTIERCHLACTHFYCFVQYSRRNRNLTISELATQANVEIDEIMSLEKDTHFKVKRETVVKLAKYFGVDHDCLIEMARLDEPHFDPTWEKEAKQHPDKVASTEKLDNYEDVILEVLETHLEREANRNLLQPVG